MSCVVYNIYTTRVCIGPQVQKRYGHPHFSEEEGPFPEGLQKLGAGGGFFRRGPNRDGQLDAVSIQTIGKTRRSSLYRC